MGPYLKEISYLTKQGYVVFAYDNTGCGISEGESMAGLSQSIVDLKHALKFIKQQGLPILLYGHSWRGFTVSAILNEKPDVVAVAERSGFNSGKEIVFERGQKMVGFFMHLSSPFTSLYEHIQFGKYADYTAIGGINKVKIPVLIMHSKDDEEVPYALSIANKTSEITNANVYLHDFDNRSHDISLSDNALAYRAEKKKEWTAMACKYEKDISQNIVDTYYTAYDYTQAEELDTSVTDEIVNFFDNAIKN